MILRTRQARGVAIAGVGRALPCDVDDAVRPLDSAAAWQAVFGEAWRDELSARGWSADHAAERYGVVVRHAWPRADGLAAERSLALALHAATRALEDADLEADALSAILVGTATSPRASASIAAQIGSAFGTDAAALDVRMGGASGLAAWTQGAGYVASGSRAVLVVAVDVVPDFLAPDDVVHRMLFSCGAAAFVLRAAPGEPCGLEGAVAGRASAAGRAFTIPASLPPATGANFWFEGPDADYAASLDEAWATAHTAYRELSPNDPDHFLPYAVTRAQVSKAGERAELDVDASLEHLSTHGCLGSASVLFQVADGIAGGAMRAGQRIGTIAVGGGIAWQALGWRL